MHPTSRRDGLSRRELLASGATVAVASTLAPILGPPAQAVAPVGAAVPPFELEEVGVAELQAGLTSGRWTARGLAEAYLARIAALDRQAPLRSSRSTPRP